MQQEKGSCGHYYDHKQYAECPHCKKKVCITTKEGHRSRRAKGVVRAQEEVGKIPATKGKTLLAQKGIEELVDSNVLAGMIKEVEDGD